MNNPYKEIELKPVVETVAQEALRLLSAVPEEGFNMYFLHDEEAGTHCAIGWMRHFERETNTLCRKSVEYLQSKGIEDDNVADVNDGNTSLYPQPTPKQRVVALLTDMVNTGY